jgi:hypothetical protein
LLGADPAKRVRLNIDRGDRRRVDTTDATLFETHSFTRRLSEQGSEGRLAADLVGWSAGIVEQHG